MLSDYHFPEDLRYDLRHTWVRTVGDDAVIGIADDAQTAWGNAGFVQLPTVGAEIVAGEAIGQVSCALAGPCDLFTPLSGTVIAVNEALAEDPSLINADPYGEGWLLLLEPADPAQLRDLLDAGTYRRVLGEPLPHNLDKALYGIFEHSQDAMMLLDRYRRIVAMNQAAERLTGQNAESVVGSTPCFQLFHCEAGGEPMHGVDCFGVEAFDAGGCTGRFRIVRPNGDIFPVYASYSPLPPPNGSGPLMLVIMRAAEPDRP